MTSDNAIDVEVDIQCSVSLEGAASSKSKALKRHYHDMTYILTLTSDLDFIDFRRIPLSRSSNNIVIIYSRNISQDQSPPRREVVLCHNPINEAKPKYMGLYVVGESDLSCYIVITRTAAGRHRRRLPQLTVQA